MTDWFPTNKQIIKVFILNSLGWAILGILYGVLTTFESVLMGTGAGILFTALYVVQLWNNDNIRTKLLTKYLHSEIFRTLGLQLTADSTITGTIKGYKIELTPIVDQTSTTRFNLEINLSDKSRSINDLNINRTLGKLKYSLNDSILFIPNWSPPLWNYKNLEKVVGKVEELLNNLENG